MSDKILLITKPRMTENLKFIALFIAIYESFEDYVIDISKQLFIDPSFIREGSVESIQEREAVYKKEQEGATWQLEKCDKTQLSQDQIDNLETIAKYNYKKEVKDGYVRWLDPDYDKLIAHREMPKDINVGATIFIKSLLYFVDNKAISKADFEKIIEIKKLRNKFAHEMAKLIYGEISDDWKKLFVKLVNFYIRINNYWSVNFELGIVDDDIPTNIEIDYGNVMTVELYNLVASIDLLQNTEFIPNTNTYFLRGLYNSLYLPEKIAPIGGNPKNSK